MNRKLKMLSMVALLTFSLLTIAFSEKISAESVQTAEAENILQQALNEKTFYKYNVAYEAIMKVEDGKTRDDLMVRLSSIANIVWTEDIRKFNSMLAELLNTKGSGKIYDDIQSQVNSALLNEVDKAYLLGELNSWGRKLVYTPDYADAVDKVVMAWNSLNRSKADYDYSITKAQKVVANVKNPHSKEYLLDQIKQIKSKYSSSLFAESKTANSEAYNYNGNFINGAFVSQEGGYIYYVDKASSDTHQDNENTLSRQYNLYKINKGGSKEIIYSGNIKNINVDNGWIYFNKDENYYNHGIYKIKNDGTQGMTLVDNQTDLAQKSGDYIYYTTSFNDIWRIKWDGSSKEQIYVTDTDTRYIENINISKDWIYFSTYYDTGESLKDRYIYKIKQDGSGLTKIAKADVTIMNVSGEWIYYINSEGLFKMKCDGSENKKLVAGDFSSYCSLNVALNSIYYTYDGDIYRVDLNGNNKIKLASGSKFTTVKINLVSNRIYYYDDLSGYTKLKFIIDESLVALDNEDDKSVQQPSINIFKKGDIYNNLTVYDAKLADINGDVKNENIFIAGNKNDSDYTDSKLFIQDSETGKILNSCSISSYFTDFKNKLVIQDFNGDRVSDIMISLNANTAAGSYNCFVYTFTDNQLSELLSEENNQLPKSNFTINHSDSGVLRVDSKDTNKSFSIDITEDKNESSYFIKRGGPFFKEVDNDGDGTYELNVTEYISGNNYGDIVAEVTTTYKYNSVNHNWDINDFNLSSNYPLIQPSDTFITDIPGSNFVLYGNTNDNIINDGLVVQKDDWIYYVRTTYTYISKDSYSQRGKLYKRRVNGQDEIELSNYAIGDLNLISNTLYYNGGNISKIDIDGTSQSVITDDYPMQINVVGDWIYYLNYNDNSRIYKIKTDGSGKTRVNNDFSMEMSIVDDWIYYCNGSDGDSLYKIKTDGTEKTKVMELTSSTTAINDGWIYYHDSMDWAKLYKVKIDGSYRTKVSNDNIQHMNIFDGWIYYSNGNENNTIYKIKTDGTNKTKLCDDRVANIEVIGDWIYYENENDNRNLYRIKIDGTMRERL